MRGAMLHRPLAFFVCSGVCVRSDWPTDKTPGNTVSFRATPRPHRRKQFAAEHPVNKGGLAAAQSESPVSIQEGFPRPGSETKQAAGSIPMLNCLPRVQSAKKYLGANRIIPSCVQLALNAVRKSF